MSHAAKKFSIFVAVLLLVFMIAVSTKASPETIVRVTPDKSIAEVGETFTVSITIADVQNLYGLEIKLNWSSSILELVDVDVRLGSESHDDGVLHNPVELVFNETTQEQGKYMLVATSTTPAPSFNGSGNIVKMTFSVASDGNSALNLQSKLSDKPPPDGVSSPIPHSIQNGYFGETPESPLWFYMIVIVVISAVLAVSILYYRKMSRKTHQSNWERNEG